MCADLQRKGQTTFGINETLNYWDGIIKLPKLALEGKGKEDERNRFESSYSWFAHFFDGFQHLAKV